MVLLGALLLVPVAALILVAARSAADTDASNTAVLASTAAAVAASTASTGAGTADEAVDVLAAACQAMDDYLPAQILAISATPDSVRVTVSAPSRTGRAVTHSFAASWAQNARGGSLDGDRPGVFSFTGADLAVQTPACVGRAS